LDKTLKPLEWTEYVSLKLDNKEKRIAICDYLKIPYCNNKQLWKKLNMLNIDYDKIVEIINHCN
jgi:ribonuclease M5